jgi:hypothetical protein
MRMVVAIGAERHGAALTPNKDPPAWRSSFRPEIGPERMMIALAVDRQHAIA